MACMTFIFHKPQSTAQVDKIYRRTLIASALTGEALSRWSSSCFHKSNEYSAVEEFFPLCHFVSFLCCKRLTNTDALYVRARRHTHAYQIHHVKTRAATHIYVTYTCTHKEMNRYVQINTYIHINTNAHKCRLGIMLKSQSSLPCCSFTDRALPHSSIDTTPPPVLYKHNPI